MHGKRLGEGGRSTKESQNYFLSKITLVCLWPMDHSFLSPPIFVNKVLMLEVGAQRRDPGLAVRSKQGFLGDMSLEEFRE